MQIQQKKSNLLAELVLLGLLLYAGWWFYTTQLQHHEPQNQGQQTVSLVGQHDVRGAPTLSADQVNAILAQHGSPAAGTGQTFYEQSLQTGINDTWPLGFFWHESNDGLAGVARLSKSIGNLRCIPTAACVNGYAYFASWEQGITAWYSLIKNLYINTWNLVTVEQIVPKYAPPGDRNDDKAYIQSVVATVASYGGAQ